MPFGDGSGPVGMGPMSGRAAGFCAGYNQPGYSNCFIGRGGQGWGRGGRGRGLRRRGNWFNQVPVPGSSGYWNQMPLGTPPEAEREALNAQIQNLEAILADVKVRLAELASGENETGKVSQ